MAVKIIDKTTDSKRTTAFYYLVVHCLKCGKRHIAKYRWGDKAKKNEACPECGITGMLIDIWQSNTPAEAIEAAKRT